MASAKPGVHQVQLRPICVADTLVKGNKFIMFTDSSSQGTPVNLKVDEKGYILYWKDQNKDMDFLDISLIRDTRTGNQVRVPKDHKLKDSLMIGQQEVSLEDKMVTIVYGTDFVNLEYLHFVCGAKETAKLWSEELLKYSVNLLALNSDSLTYLEKIFTRFNLVLNQEGKVSMKNIVKACAKNSEDKRKVEKALESVGFHAGKMDAINPAKFTFDNFFNFYRHLVGRTEVDKIFDELGAKKKPYLTAQQFVDFLNKQQRDSRLNEILYPHYSLAKANELIHKYENKSGMAAKEKGHLSQEGFLKFLMSEDNNVIPPHKLDLNEDMDQALSHYFINSSHNTYLSGHQLNGKSSVEMYHMVLLSGCRCIELDCWDGKEPNLEPIITHGYTFCTEILFKDVIEAIAQSAFKTSDYPVILSFENHCNPKQQAKMANYCRTIFGDLLLINPLESNPLKPEIPLPSPNQLKRKIIIKNKKKHFHRERNSKRVRQKASNSVTENSSVRTRLSEVEEDVELLTPAPASPTLEPPDSPLEPPSPPPMESVPSPATEHEPKSPSRIALEKNLSICSEGTEASEGIKDGDDLDDSDSESSESEDDDEQAMDAAEKKKQKKILTEEEKKRKARMKKEKGTAGKEASAAMEMSLLVNYIQPVHFHSFEASEKRKRSFEITSFVESQGTSLLKEFPVEFVNYNKRQMSRIYPKGTRVDSSNFIPQVFWNAGCQLVALNFQSLDLAMQINLGMFEYNCRTGYVLKPDFMRRQDRNLDPFAESTINGIIAGSIQIKVISGQFLSDKKVGTYVEVEMYGLPTDTVRKKFRTKVVQNNGINPVYDEDPFVFKKVVLPDLAIVRIAVYEEQNKNLIGHRVLPVEGLRPGYRHIPLRNEANQPLNMPSLFVHIVVRDYVPDDLLALTEALANPIKYQSELDKHAQQLAVLNDDEDDEDDLNLKDDGLLEAISEEQQTPSKEVQEVIPGPLNKRTNSVKSGGSGVSINPMPAEAPKAQTYVRGASQQHLPVSKQDSSTSANSSGSSQSSSTANFKRMPSGPEISTSYILQNTKLDDSSILIPTPLSDLRKGKSYLKAIAKREKELDSLKRKHDRAREILEENHQQQLGKLISNQTKARMVMEKQHSKVLKKLAKEGQGTEQKQNQLKGEMQELINVQENKRQEMKSSHKMAVFNLGHNHHLAELELRRRHHGNIYDALLKLMESNHLAHDKSLQEIHDQEVTELMKLMDLKNREHMKSLGKKHKDKQELSRVKREEEQKHVERVVKERQRLQDILTKRKGELEAKLDEIKKEFQREKEEVMSGYQLEYEEALVKLEEDLGNNVDDDVNEEDNSDLQRSGIDSTDVPGDKTTKLTNENRRCVGGAKNEGVRNGEEIVSNGEVNNLSKHISTINVNSKENGQENMENGRSQNGKDNLEKVNSEERLTTM